MATISLKHNQVGLPQFELNPEDLESDIKDYNLFDLSSHARARTAIEFGLKMRHFGAHIFIVGGDQRGRMTSTLEYLQNYINQLPAPRDWVYLNNFDAPHSPIPFSLPTGQGYHLKKVLKELIDYTHLIFNEIFTGSHYINQITELTEALETDINKEIEKLQGFAASKGLKIEHNEDEFTIISIDGPLEQDKPKKKKTKTQETEPAEPPKTPRYTPHDIQYIREKIIQLRASARIRGRELNKKIQELKKQEGNILINALFVTLNAEFKEHLGGWIDELKDDILNHIDDFLDDEQDAELKEYLVRRYSVNLFVDNKGSTHPCVIVDPSPSYESLFGSIKYKSAPAGYVTDFTLIRPGNLHRANEGILVLRAEAISNDSELWNALKTVMRDRRVHIEERYRENSMPMLDAPDPQSIPLNIQIILVGAPHWYYNHFFHDLDFRNYFKIKADIEADFPATPENISICVHLIRQIAEQRMGKKISPPAIQYLLGYTSRWANNRSLLSSKFELIADIIAEASQYVSPDCDQTICLEHLLKTSIQRRNRNSVLEDRTHRDIEEKVVLIDTTGYRVGAVNGLSVLSMGDHEYGIPNRISARTYAGEDGVINIERLTDMGGPIQQKGALILDGFINGLFSQKHMVSCSCSLTFEQNYSGIEGDSATLAELLALLSSLSQVPARQDIAVTGSLNQLGEVQAVGGINHKIEGFFRTCQYRGLTGTQGVIVPTSNVNHIIVRDDIAHAVRQKKFFIWPVQHVEEAVQLIFGQAAGQLDKKGRYPKNSIYGLVAAQLKKFSDLMEREWRK